MRWIALLAITALLLGCVKTAEETKSEITPTTTVTPTPTVVQEPMISEVENLTGEIAEIEQLLNDLQQLEESLSSLENI
ncbi:MAG: hypothetical protein ABWW66_06235 [Archaeoglobaceae archaeon]